MSEGQIFGSGPRLTWRFRLIENHLDRLLECCGGLCNVGIGGKSSRCEGKGTVLRRFEEVKTGNLDFTRES